MPPPCRLPLSSWIRGAGGGCKALDELVLLPQLCAWEASLWQGLVMNGSSLPFSFLAWVTYGTTVSCLLYLRMKKKNLPRPYKVDGGGHTGLFQAEAAA